MNQMLLSTASTHAPDLATYIWIGGGSLGLIAVIVIIVLVLGR